MKNEEVKNKEVYDIDNRLQELEAQVRVLVSALDKFVVVTVQNENGKKKKMRLGKAVQSAKLNVNSQHAEPTPNQIG